MLVVAAFVAGALAMPASAQPPGNYSITFEYLVASYFDFKDGVGIADPNDVNNPCTALLLGLRGIQPLAETWEVDQNMGTNLNGPGIGVSNLVPPLAPVGGWLPASGGVNLGFDCPIPGAPVSPPDPRNTDGLNHNMWFIWSGVNWRSAEADSSANLFLCTQKTFASSSPGCLAIPDNRMHLWVSACDPSTVLFGHDYTDGKGKYLGGVPFDLLNFKNDMIKCTPRRSVNYTDTIQDFAAGGAGQTFDIIKNEAVVPLGTDTTYMAVCWQIGYLNFSDPLNPTTHLAQAHDWKLIIDLLDTPANIVAALQLHYGGAQPGDNGVGPATVALRGFYSDDAGYNKGTSTTGQNGPGPCANGTQYTEKLKKPHPIDNPPAGKQSSRCVIVVLDGVATANNGCGVCTPGPSTKGKTFELNCFLGSCYPFRGAIVTADLLAGPNIQGQKICDTAVVASSKDVVADGIPVVTGGFKLPIFLPAYCKADFDPLTVGVVICSEVNFI
ncbi:MAG: hypothetical protein LC620_00755 [Halobacteriales archaeon]|nr:hypothetical protein [Halobacteriales archaeon]